MLTGWRADRRERSRVNIDDGSLYEFSCSRRRFAEAGARAKCPWSSSSAKDSRGFCKALDGKPAIRGFPPRSPPHACPIEPVPSLGFGTTTTTPTTFRVTTRITGSLVARSVSNLVVRGHFYWDVVCFRFLLKLGICWYGKVTPPRAGQASRTRDAAPTAKPRSTPALCVPHAPVPPYE